MTQKSWAGQVVDEFFKARKSPTRRQCDQLALSISEASEVYPVDVPGSLSYTVVCTRTQSQDQHHKESIVLSFRQSQSTLDKETVRLAQVIHGCLVPHARNHGIMSGSDPPLGIYAMPLLPGVACLETLSYEADMGPDEEAKHVCFVMHLARYNHLLLSPIAYCHRVERTSLVANVQSKGTLLGVGPHLRLWSLRRAPSARLESPTG